MFKPKKQNRLYVGGAKMAEEEINFDAEEEVSQKEEGQQELGVDDFKGGNYLKTPAVGEELVMEVEKVIKNRNTTGTNNTTGAKFIIGLKDKTGNVRRIDVHSKDGVFTVGSWEVYFKLFDNRAGQEGALIKYAKEHNNSFTGAKISLKRLWNGTHASMSPEDLAKIRSSSVEEATKYKADVQNAMKEKKLYEVKLV